MFYIIRCIVCGAFLLLVFIIVKDKPHKVAKCLIAFGVVILMFYCSIYFPIEQVYGFNTPQEVFDYMYIGDIGFVEYGQDTAYVAYQSPIRQSEFKSAIIEKRDDKYIAKVVGKIDTIYSFLDDGCSVKIYSVKDTNDYYITIFGMFDQTSISDSDKNIFQFLSINDIGFTTVYIQNIDNYQLNIQMLNKQKTIEVNRSTNGSLEFSSTENLENS